MNSLASGSGRIPRLRVVESTSGDTTVRRREGREEIMGVGQLQAMANEDDSGCGQWRTMAIDDEQGEDRGWEASSDLILRGFTTEGKATQVFFFIKKILGVVCKKGRVGW